MRHHWFVTAAVVTCALALETGFAQAPAVDAERLLTERFGFTTAEVAQARNGQAVAKLLPSQDAAEVGVVGAVRINTASDRLVVWLKDVASFRKAAELGLSRRISDPPQIGDFADLSLDPDELYALRDCRPGKCDLRLGDKAIQQFQTGVDWTAGDATRRANLLTRQLMLNLAQAYASGGDQALGAYHDEKAPRSARDEFLKVLRSSTGLHEIAPPLAAYLERFPSVALPQSEQFLYWGKGGVGPEASITLHQLIIYRPPGGSVFVVDKQLYASRYADAGLAVITLVPASDGKGFFALIGARARSTMLSGVSARLLRGRVEKATRETATMYLDWIRASLVAPIPK